MEFRILDENAKYVFHNIDGKRYDAVFLGQKTFGLGLAKHDYAWAVIPDLKSVVEFCPRNVADVDKVVIIFDFERIHPFDRILKVPVSESIFHYAKDRDKMYAQVKTWHMLG